MALAVKNISYPSFKYYFDLCGSINMNLLDFINNIKNERISDLILDPKFYNVVFLNSALDKYVENLEAQNIVKQLANLEGKTIRYYSLQETIGINCIDRTFSIFDIINIEGKFDLLFLVYPGTIYNNKFFYDKLETTTLYLSKNGKNFTSIIENEIISDNLFIMDYSKINVIERKESIKKCDINLSDILPYCKKNGDIFRVIDNAIKEYIKHNSVSFTLDNTKTNILVLCANERSISSKKYKKLVKKILGDDVNFENTDTYFVGNDIAVTNPPFVNRVNLENIGTDIGFDLIIIEHCPYFIIDRNIILLERLLNDNGMIISPDYEKSDKMLPTIFNEVIKIDNYIGYLKNSENGAL